MRPYEFAGLVFGGAMAGHLTASRRRKVSEKVPKDSYAHVLTTGSLRRSPPALGACFAST